MGYTYDYPHPAVTVDVAIFTFADDELRILLIERGSPPFEGRWALPGGFVGMQESLRRAAWRELREETGVRAAHLEQLGAFGRPGRDPRERVISVVYYALVPQGRLRIRAASDARDARLFDVDALPDLAFDHARILRHARERLRERAADAAMPLRLLDDRFTLSDLRRVLEILRGERLDRRNFRKHILALGLVEPTGEKRKSGAHRPAELYRVRSA